MADPAADPRRRLRNALVRVLVARRRRRRDQGVAGRLLTVAVCAVAALLITVSALNARGIDLRPGRNTDLVSLVQDQSRRNADLARRLTAVRQEVDALAARQNEGSDLAPEVARQAGYAGLRAVSGPAVTVILDDAPDEVTGGGIDPDLLVVHQQDIQAVVNALWSGGAEAMTVQGQRVISTTGIKCVGNTVVLHGIPYAPPYVVSAIGDPVKLRAALARSPAVTIYKQYVDAYGLGYQEHSQPQATFPAFEGTIELRYAEPLVPDGSASPTPGR